MDNPQETFHAKFIPLCFGVLDSDWLIFLDSNSGYNSNHRFILMLLITSNTSLKTLPGV